MARKRGRDRSEFDDMPAGPSTARGLARDNPVAAGGTLVMALTGSLIVANAVGFQPGRHPAPLFQTRENAAAPDAAALAAADQAEAGFSTAPVHEISTLVLDIQTALRSQGLYEGPLDGMKGPATERAIRNYQRIIGQVETGDPSEALLAIMTLQKVAPVAGPDGTQGLVPVPRAKPGGAASTALATAPVPPSALAGPAGQPRPGQIDQPSDPKPAATPVPPQDIRLVQIQQLLSDLGYGPLMVDGIMGENTSAAIRRFELDRGLPLTGLPSAPVIERLEMISGKKINR
ncbi:peptidoglycan-binding protein [Roseibium aquae]|uniref:Peptidoglycan-binding protein n=1 Tax=Roseibium aquae TaxID=1323746 RepID=A0A916X223_9HYPH|nr:peptidoglycan-binding protein [Roseibium aquae]GGB50705.1 peptidoglycan-binding protein [Roseibium aquae]